MVEIGGTGYKRKLTQCYQQLLRSYEIEPQLLVTLRFFADLLFQRREDERVVQRFVNTEEFVNLGIEEVKDQSDSAFSGP